MNSGDNLFEQLGTELSPFNDIPDIPIACADCPILLSAAMDATTSTMFSRMLIDGVPDDAQRDKILKDLQDHQGMEQMVRQFFLDSGKSEEDLESTEQIIQVMLKEDGKTRAASIEVANDAIDRLAQLVNACDGKGQRPIDIPREGERPVRLTACSGAINSAKQPYMVETTVTIEELD